MKRLAAGLLVAVCAVIAWQAWQPPASTDRQGTVRAAIPQNGPAKQEKWRVLTHRMVWKQAATAMQERLTKAGIKLTRIQRKEPVELHAFDDPGTFKTQQAAEKVKAIWRKKGIKAEVLKREITYGVGLGRFYLVDYAERMQAQLKKTGLPYQYERRTVVIPAFRFVSGKMDKAEAEKLWRTLQDMGIASPVLISESRYLALYGKKPAP